MTTIIIVEKLGTIKELVVKSFTEDSLYKKAGFKSPDGFKMHSKWDIEMNNKLYSIRLFGKTNGRGTQENKYEFPSPADNILLFGNCVLINTIDDKVVGLFKHEWEMIYKKLCGGFIDIDESDSDESDESDLEGVLTKEGYIKDNFIVGDDDISIYDSSSDEGLGVVVKKNINPKRKIAFNTIKTPRTSKISHTLSRSENDDLVGGNYMDCAMELDQEEYI